MDSFLKLYGLYRSVPRWKVALSIYQGASSRLKWLLWSTKAFFAVFASLQFILTPNWPYFLLMLAAACAWGWLFYKARKSAFSHEYSAHPERMKYFERDYQYVRYLQFREKLNGVASRQDIQGALAFLSEQIQSNSVPPVSSHPVITFLFAAIFAILGSAAGHWPAKYTVASLLVLLVLLYFSYMILGAVNTTQSDLKEFKRFLLWARDEEPEA